MAIQFGSTAINAIKYRNASGVLQDVTSVVRNGATVWSNVPAEWAGLKFTANTAGSTIKLRHPDSAPNVSLLYSTDDGESWSGYTLNDTLTLGDAGDTICLKATDSGNEAFSDGDYKNYFVMTGSVSASGNIMSIIDATMAETAVSDYCFEYLFSNCTSLTSAPEIIVTALGEYCFNHMFSGCANIKISENGGEGYVVMNIPSGTETAIGWGNLMFIGTGGSFTGAIPSIGTPYYCYQ